MIFHVMVYCGTVCEMHHTSFVSIYHMLLFIILRMRQRTTPLRFNTSHVTVYRHQAGRSVSRYVALQYISCYYLSKARQWYLDRTGSFNTSHITVYRKSRATAYSN